MYVSDKSWFIILNFRSLREGEYHILEGNIACVVSDSECTSCLKCFVGVFSYLVRKFCLLLVIRIIRCTFDTVQNKSPIFYTVGKITIFEHLNIWNLWKSVNLISGQICKLKQCLSFWTIFCKWIFSPLRQVWSDIPMDLFATLAGVVWYFRNGVFSLFKACVARWFMPS